jgi:hypothetical protein
LSGDCHNLVYFAEEVAPPAVSFGANVQAVQFFTSLPWSDQQPSDAADPLRNIPITLIGRSVQASDDSEKLSRTFQHHLGAQSVSTGICHLEVLGKIQENLVGLLIDPAGAVVSAIALP